MALTIQTVDLASLNQYPGNPRLGDVAAIAASLEATGQYRPVVVQQSTRYILAGNHTAQAADRLGWTSIEASLVDVDDSTARQIVLADNRTADLGTYDSDALTDLLSATAQESMERVLAAGYSQADIDALAIAVQSPVDTITEINVDDFNLAHTCPRCQFQWE